MVDVRGSDFEQAKQKILKHIDDCIRGLEIACERKVEKLYWKDLHPLKTSTSRLSTNRPQNSLDVQERRYWQLLEGAQEQ